MMRDAVRILELRSVRGTGGGPEKTILLSAARSDPAAYDITVCYLRDARDRVFTVDDDARRLGVRYREIVERHSFDVRAWASLRELVREQRIEIVHAHEYKSDFLAWWLAWMDGTTPLATVHGWTGHSARERRFYYPIDRRLLARFPRLIAVSSDIRGALLDAGAKPDRIMTVLNGIDATAFRRQPAAQPRIRALYSVEPGEVVIGSVGRLEPQKRFDLLIEAFSRLRHKWPAKKLKLLIAGEGSERVRLTDAIDQRGLTAACQLLGHQTDIVSLHHVFDMFVQSSDYEGTPNAALEAMALETPLVATEAGGTSELIRHGVDGLLVPCGDLAALVDAMHRVLAAPDEATDRARSARRRTETDLSFDARSRAVERIYESLAASRSRISR